MAGDYRLIAVYAPVAEAAGFVEPVFLAGDRRYVQVVDAETDRVAGFAQVLPELATSMVEGAEEDEAALLSPGLRRVYAFRLPDGQVLYGDRDGLARQLEARFLQIWDSQAAGGHPLTVLDVLSFLGRDEACAEDMTVRRLAALLPEGPGGRSGQGAARRLFQRGFVYRAASGRLMRPALADLIALPSAEVRAVVRTGVAQMRSGRLVPVACLALVACGIVLAEPLAPVHGLSDDTVTVLAQALAGLSVVWLLAELTGRARRLGPGSAAAWVVARLKRLMHRR